MTKMTIETDNFEATNGVSLYERRWLVSDPKASIVIIHGYGEHCERYDHIAERMNAEGYSVYSYDHRGHGESPGKMGYIPSFKMLVDDLDVFLCHLHGSTQGTPTILFGHSMGGLILTEYVIAYEPDVDGLIFSSTGVKPDEDVAPFLQKISGITATLLPYLPVHFLDPVGISRIVSEVEKYMSDPKVYHGKILAKTGHELVQAMKHASAHLGAITLPMLVLHGVDDPIVSVDSSRLLMEHAASTDKSLKLYEGNYHEVFNDFSKEEFLTDVLEWIDKHIS
jgi:alpha-beta hydrolase superfamily lysophospholipase